MRFRHPTLLAIALLTVAGNPNPAAASPYDTEVLVQPHTASTIFSWEEALSALPAGSYPAAVPPSIAAGPVHGELLTNETEELVYVPDSSFWELGTDSFVVRVASLEPDAFVTVTLQAGDYRQGCWLDQPFEGPVEDLEGHAFVGPEGAITGSMGLRAIVEDDLTLDAVFSYVDDIGRPPGAEGSTEELKMRAPPGPSSPLASQAVVIYSLDRELGQPAADLVLVPGETGWQISARVYARSPHTTEPFTLVKAEHKLSLDWWKVSPTQTGGLRLWVDGEPVGSITGLSDWDTGEARRRVGAMLEPPAVEGTSLDVDDLHSCWAESARAAFGPMMRDGFEDGLGAWQTSSAPYIETLPGAALIGLEGLEIEAVYGFDGALLDSSPAAETSFGVRMRLSVDSLGLPSGGTLELLALSGLDTGSLGDEARLVLQNTFAGFRLFAQARSGAGWLSTPLETLTAGTNTIELRWEAGDPGVENGWVRLWVDGDPGTRIAGLDNAGAAIESVRLGAWNVSVGTQGALLVDAFESWSFVPPPSGP